MSVNIKGNHDCFQFTDRNLPYGIRHLAFFLFETLCKGCGGLSGNPTSHRTPCDMPTGNPVGCLSAITPVMGAEKSYQAGYGMGFWGNLTTPIMIVMALTGYCIYRWRQTRCLSKWQFIEMRYGSRTFRLITTIISPLSKMVTNAIGPAIATYFSLYYLFLHSLVLSPQSGFQSEESKTAPSFL